MQNSIEILQVDRFLAFVACVIDGMHLLGISFILYLLLRVCGNIVSRLHNFSIPIALVGGTRSPFFSYCIFLRFSCPTVLHMRSRCIFFMFVVSY